MATNKYEAGNQYPLYAYTTFGPNNGADTMTIELPPGAVIVGGAVRVGVAGAASLKVTVKDAATAPVSLFGSVAADALAATALTTTGLLLAYPAGTTLTVALSASDNTVAGSVAIEYVIAGRLNEN